MSTFRLLDLWRHKVIQQLFRFGIVGTIAAITHISIVIFLVEIPKMWPLLANVFAFCFSFSVSFTGHHRWTFANHTTPRHHSLRRFFLIAVGTFILNEGLFYILLYPLQLHYVLALFVVLICVPPLTFAGSKLWAFRHH